METPYVNPNIPSHAESTERTAAYPADAALAAEYSALKTLLKDNAEKNTGKSVAVSFDLEVYRRISRDMSDGLKTVLLKKVLA